MNKKISNVVKWAAVLFMVFYLFSQAYSSLINPVTTDTVYKHSTFSGYETVGYTVRSESVVESSASGVISFEVEDGGRVAKNGTIAKLYSSEEEAERHLKIERLEAQIAALETIENYNDLNAADINGINSKIHNQLIKTVSATQGGKIVDVSSEETLLEMLNRKQIVTGQISNFDMLVASLKAECDALKSGVLSSLGDVKSPASGYVIYSVDGYENCITLDELDSVSAEKLDSVTPVTPSEDAVCKIVSDYEWYIVAKIPFNESLNLKEGSKTTLKTHLLSAPELKVTVKSINKQSLADSAVAVFACNTMNTELAGIRNLDITVVYDEYEGLKVDNRAIRIVDGVKGVYVRTASQVKFVPINVIWAGDNYSLVEQEASTTKVLRIYDEIIVKGKNLYDGKIVK